MDNTTIVINKIYDNMIKIILTDVETEYHEAFCQKYLETLKNRYSDIEVETENVDELYQMLYQVEYDEWQSMSSSMKKHIFMNDVALNNIIDISSIAFKCAKNRLDNNVSISKQEAEQYILKLKELYNSVQDFNKQLAMWYISEANVDFDYASNQTVYMSTRISHLKR